MDGRRAVSQRQLSTREVGQAEHRSGEGTSGSLGRSGSQAGPGGSPDARDGTGPGGTEGGAATVTCSQPERGLRQLSEVLKWSAEVEEGDRRRAKKRGRESTDESRRSKAKKRAEEGAQDSGKRQGGEVRSEDQPPMKRREEEKANGEGEPRDKGSG